MQDAHLQKIQNRKENFCINSGLLKSCFKRGKGVCMYVCVCEKVKRLQSKIKLIQVQKTTEQKCYSIFMILLVMFMFMYSAENLNLERSRPS